MTKSQCPKARCAGIGHWGLAIGHSLGISVLGHWSFHNAAHLKHRQQQAGLDQRLQYDRSPRKSLLDHFYDAGTNLQSVSRGEAAEHGDFVQGVYESKIRRSSDRIQVQLTRLGAPISTNRVATRMVSNGRNGES